MAYPEDEEQGTMGFLQTSPTGTTESFANGDVVNYAPPRPPVGALNTREAQITALLPALPENLKRFMQPQNAASAGITVAPDTASRDRDESFARFGTGLPQEVHLNFSSHKGALAEADKYLTVAGHIQNMRNEIESKLDSADFLKELAQIDHSTPNFDATTAKLLAKYPRAAGQTVENALQALGRARQTYLAGVAPGGADEFGDGTPEREAYINRLHQTKNPRAARAHANNVAKGEEMIKTALAAGVLKLDEDFPEWKPEWAKDSKARPAIYNADGSVNYHQAGLLAAKRAADFGKAAKEEDRDEARDLLTIRQFADPDMQESNPDLKTLYTAALNRQNAREKKRAGQSTTSSNTAAGASRYSAGL